MKTKSISTNRDSSTKQIGRQTSEKNALDFKRTGTKGHSVQSDGWSTPDYIEFSNSSSEFDTLEPLIKELLSIDPKDIDDFHFRIRLDWDDIGKTVEIVV